MTFRFFSFQILDSQNFEDFSAKPLDSMAPQDSSLIPANQDQPESSALGSLGQHVELALQLDSGAGAMSAGTAADAETTIAGGLNFASVEPKPAAGTEALPMDAETQRRLSLQEPQTPLDSQIPQRHGSDRGGS